MSEQYSTETWQELEQRAQTLMDAAKVLEEFAEANEGMMDDVEEAEEIQDKMESGIDACEKLSVAMTVKMFQNGYIPDFNSIDRDGDDGDADDPIGFQ